MTDSNNESKDIKSFTPWEGSSVFVEQGRHWSSALIWLIAALFGGSLLWLFTAKVDQTISVRGQLTPAGSVREVDSPSSGVILNVFVADGDLVEAGQSLLRVESKGLTSRLKAIQQNLQLLKLEALSLQSVVVSNGNPDLFGPLPRILPVTDPSLKQKMVSARNQTLQTRSQLRQLSYRLDSLKETLRLQSQITQDLKPLFDNGALSRNAYLEQVNSLQVARAELSTFEAEINRIVGVTVSQLNDLHLQEINLTSELASIRESISYRTVKAPIAGKIFDLQVSDHSVVSNAESLLKIVPGNRLTASVAIPNSDIGFVKTGLPVSVSIDSFPSGEFGYIQGSVVSIGSDILPPDQDAPFQYFPAQVDLKQQSVFSGSNSLNLQSGMGVTANIKLRSRPAITLLTDIFTKQLDGVKQFR